MAAAQDKTSSKRSSRCKPHVLTAAGDADGNDCPRIQYRLRGQALQPVYWASSSKDDAQSRPQKRFTLSSGFSQYQHEPFGGNFCRGVAAIAGIIDGIIDTALSGTACSVVSMIFPSPDTSTASKITSAEVCGSDQNQHYKNCRPPRQTLLLKSIIAALKQANRQGYVRQHT